MLGWGLALVVLWAVRLFWEPYNLPSTSMVPTLLVGDHFLVRRGYFSSHEPQRGDLAVFKLPRDNRTDYVKRIVGLPGDRIQMRAGRLYINDLLVERERIEDFVERDDARGQAVRRVRFVETLPGGRQHEIVEVSDTEFLDNTPVFTVPPGHFFTLGDNRDNSLDSRVPQSTPMHGLGFIPRENLIGRPELLFFSIDGTLVRRDRIFTSVAQR